MDNILNKKIITENIENLKIWFDENILSLNFATEIVIIIILFIISALTTKIFRNRLKKIIEKEIIKSKLLSKILSEIIKHFFGITYSTFLIISIPILNYFKIPIHFVNAVYIVILAWLIIKTISYFIQNKLSIFFIRYVIWLYAFINILGISAPVLKFAGNASIKFGNTNFSILILIKGTFLLIISLKLASISSKFFSEKIHNTDTNPTLKVLVEKSINIIIYVITFSIILSFLGIDLTAFAIFSSALGVGIGFGLQKIISNFISGFILLMDNSIKPGDTIEIGDAFGWITSLNARYTSVMSRDGKEYLIPNEELITSKVINWSHSNKNLRISLNIGISYDSDVERAMEIMLYSAKSISRIIKSPKPICYLKEFGNSSINFELLAWIDDPKNGISNVKSDIYIKIWKEFKKNNIQIPFPQVDLHVKK